MKCSIPKCVNHKIVDLDSSNSFGITFHQFPKDPKHRAAWMESIALPQWSPTHRAVICSLHFKEDDFYMTKQGSRRIRQGALPFMKPDNGPVAVRVCKLCLALDAKMYQIIDYNLDKMYQDVMGVMLNTDDVRLPTGICWECTARLQSAASFKAKALFCDALLQNHLKTNPELNLTHIQKFYEQHNNLKSSLITKEVFKFNSKDTNENESNTSFKSEVITIPYNEEIEVEVNKLIIDVIKDEEKLPIVEESIKTEVDLVPITEININELHENLNTETVYVKNDATLPVNDDFDNVAVIKNNEDDDFDSVATVKNNIDDDFDVDDVMELENSDEVDKNISEEALGCLEDVKVSKKVAKNNSGIVNEGVKKRSRPKKQPHGKPSKQIDETIFKVTKLNQEQLKQEILLRKDSEKYIQSPFKCTVCYRGFPTKDKQTRHVLKHSEQSGPIKCMICLIRVKRGCDLRAHFKQQHHEEYTCKLCPLVTRNKNVAFGHMKFHDGQKYTCPQCQAEFEKHTTLLNHLRLKHMSDNVCELCGYTFVGKNGVQAHKALKHKFDKHTEMKGPYCEVCEVKFLSQKAYDRHLRLSSKHIKSEDDPNRLSNDPSIKSRRLGAAWLKPVRRPVIRRRDVNSTPMTNGPVTCEQCGMELENRQSYESHFKFSHPGIKRTQFASAIPYMCEHCGKMFMNTTTLAGHMWVHTGQKRFECDHCHKTFSMKSNLAGHMKQHEPIRRSYECRVCAKLFAFNHNLTRHMFLHTGLRPFKCDICEKGFPSSGELRAHVDHVHLKKPRPKRVRRKGKKCEVTSTLEY